MKPKKFLTKLYFGSSNIEFKKFVRLVQAFGFEIVRVKGSHHIFKRQGIGEMVNIQNVKGKVKPYQVKQFLKIIEKYSLNILE